MKTTITSQLMNSYGLDNLTLQGAWQGEITIENHENMPGFATLFTFHQGGTTSETHPQYTPNNELGFGPLQATPGQGVWKQTGHRQYEAIFCLLIQGAAGHKHMEGRLIGINKVHYSLEIDETGKQLTGSWKSCLKAPSGDILMQGAGAYSANRITFDSLAKAQPENQDQQEFAV